MAIDFDSAPNGFGPTWKRYYENGIQPGSFGAALLCNILREAVGRADSVNINIIPAHVMWLYNNLPVKCWGCEEHYESWTKKGGLMGHTQETCGASK